MERLRAASKKPIMQLLRYMKTYRKQVSLATLYSVLNKLFDLGPPILIGAAVDVVVKGKESLIGRLGISDPVSQLLALACLTVVIWILESGFQYLFEVHWRDLAQFIQHNLRRETYSHLQEQQMSYFEDRPSGDLITVLNDDINQLERFLDHGANDLIQVVVTVVTIGAIFVVSAPEISWMALVPMPFIVWGSVWFQEKLAPRYHTMRKWAGKISSQLVNNLGGLSTIKSFGTEEYENRRINRLSEGYKKANQRVIRLSSVYVPLIGMLRFASIKTLNGQIEVGMYSVLIFVIQRMVWPLTRLGETFDLYQRAMASTRREMELHQTERKLPDGTVSLRPQNVDGEYQF